MNLLSYTLDRTTVSIPHIDIKHRKYTKKEVCFLKIYYFPHIPPTLKVFLAPAIFISPPLVSVSRLFIICWTSSGVQGFARTADYEKSSNLKHLLKLTLAFNKVFDRSNCKGILSVKKKKAY